ncbi:hypothetical protein QQF64_000338 [Cirrhinus molitorella]|uniref:Uncharacterized protein n=1 Tax=Cirrhinus molitorella TaxID=172907 RepID=A0ABR3NWW6_9TELE
MFSQTHIQIRSIRIKNVDKLPSYSLSADIIATAAPPNAAATAATADTLPDEASFPAAAADLAAAAAVTAARPVSTPCAATPAPAALSTAASSITSPAFFRHYFSCSF